MATKKTKTPVERVYINFPATAKHQNKLAKLAKAQGLSKAAVLRALIDAA